jgi:hypothetical protein
MQDASPKWSRTTPWRQGHVLAASTAASLGLAHPQEPAATLVLVIGHDCDLANDNLGHEPDVEVIVGRVVGSLDGNLTWGKAPRTLHLPLKRGNAEVPVELVSTRKTKVPKSDLAAHTPSADYSISGRDLSVLRSWLGARYNRAAFPDTFVTRMRDTKFDTRLAKVLSPRAKLISAVYFDLDEGQMLERQPGDPYELSIVLTYAPGDDPEEDAEQADAVAAEVLKAAEERLVPKKDSSSQAISISVKRCVAVSEDDVTVTRIRVLQQWRLEHMTLKADDGQPGPVLD